MTRRRFSAIAMVAGAIASGSAVGCASRQGGAARGLPTRTPWEQSLTYTELGEKRPARQIDDPRKLGSIDYRSSVRVDVSDDAVSKAVAAAGAAPSDLSDADVERFRAAMELLRAAEAFTDANARAAARLRTATDAASARSALGPKRAADRRLFDAIEAALRQDRASGAARAELDALAPPAASVEGLRRVDAAALGELVASQGDAAADMLRRANAVSAAAAELTVRAWVVGGGTRTRVHVENYDDLPRGEADKGPRLGIDRRANAEKVKEEAKRGATTSTGTRAGTGAGARGRAPGRRLVAASAPPAVDNALKNEAIKNAGGENVPAGAAVDELANALGNGDPVLILEDAAAASVAEAAAKNLADPNAKELMANSVAADAAGGELDQAVASASEAVSEEASHDIPRPLADAPPAIIDLANTTADRGDRLEVEAALRMLPPPAAGPAAGAGGGASSGEAPGSSSSSSSSSPAVPPPVTASQSFDVGRFGLVGEVSAGLIFVNRFSEGNDDDQSDFIPAPSASYILHYRVQEWDEDFRGPFWEVYRFADPGIGLNVAVLPFDDTTRVGLGIEATFFDDVLHVGYGYALTGDDDPQYWYVGIGILETLGKLGELAVGRKDLVPTK